MFHHLISIYADVLENTDGLYKEEDIKGVFFALSNLSQSTMSIKNILPSDKDLCSLIVALKEADFLHYGKSQGQTASHICQQ